MKSLPALALVVLVMGSVLLVVLPSYLVSPMRSQTPDDLQWSHTLSTWAPALALIGLVAGVALAVIIWRRPGARLLGKVMVVVALVPLVLSTFATRLYLAEETFARLTEVVRIPASDATHVLSDDLVLGVKLGSEAAAYPLPIIGYHHIANDTLAGEPFVVTY
jgi:hypothetical protein